MLEAGDTHATFGDDLEAMREGLPGCVVTDVRNETVPHDAIDEERNAPLPASQPEELSFNWGGCTGDAGDASGRDPGG